MSIAPSLETPPSPAARRHWVAPPAALRALLAQLGAAVITVAYAAAGLREGGTALHPILLHSILAAALGHAMRLPIWWLPINALFLPLAFWAQRLAVHPAWFLAGFTLLVAFFWTTYRTRVPLYLSSRRTCEHIAALLPADSTARVLDLGCGFGGVLLTLHRLRPELQLSGREIAPIPAWIARARLRRLATVDIRRTDFWHEDFSRYDLVYAFLSPEPMSQLWSKVRREMRPGTLFVSNAFDIDGATPDLVIPFAGGHRSSLYVWRL